MLKSIKKILFNLPGWRTDRKIIVIESDDWGSIRMPSFASFEYLKSKRLHVSSGDALRYNNKHQFGLMFQAAFLNPILPYMLLDFKAGVEVESFSIEDYTQKVIDLIENEQKLNNFVKFGKVAVERFLPSKIAQDWEDLFKS